MITATIDSPVSRVLTDVSEDLGVAGVLAAADLLWSLDQRSIHVDGIDGPMPGYLANVRNAWAGVTPDRVLSVVSTQYRTIQNTDVLQAVWPVVQEGFMTPVQAGSIKGGQRCFTLFELADGLMLNDDPHRRNLLLTWGHDGRTALTIRPWISRINCSNVMTGVIRGSVLTLRHDRIGQGGVPRLGQAIQAKILPQFDAYERAWDGLMHTTIMPDTTEEFLERAFPMPTKDLTDRKISSVLKARGDVRQQYQFGADQRDLHGTMAGLVSAYSFRLDHLTRGDRKSRGTRILQGANDRALAGAVSIARQLVK